MTFLGHGYDVSPRRSPAPVGGAYRFGDTPYTQEAADRTARRIRKHVQDDPHKRNAQWWARAIGLTDDERVQVMERYAELPE